MIRFLIVTTGYNCESYVKPCFDSIKAQTYKNYAVAVLDDGSTDHTGRSIAKYMEDEWWNDWNINNQGTYYARHRAIEQSGFEHDVIVLLDMDDQLLPHALETIAREYQANPNLLMTYGSFRVLRGQPFNLDLEYPDHIHESRDYRKDTFRCTHPRTFRKELYHAVPKWNLTQAEIQSYPDAHLLFSMMEMAGKDRIKLIKEPIYIYEQYNPIRTLDRFGKDTEGYEEICNRPKFDLLT